ncbi:hypothetical protein M6B38_330705 [Iris pallida]|uniref:Uncharacterized protein n=1 Tax=Iris pallida TaxID=29817 RepID=A0AAX6H569_IRIPA|nr:hypothetical protein M6B38_330705 [Iris pallida]
MEWWRCDTDGAQEGGGGSTERRVRQQRWSAPNHDKMMARCQLGHERPTTPIWHRSDVGARRL